MEIVTKKIKDMNRAAYNPRVDLQPGDEDYETIKKSITTYGLVEPIVWNKRTNTVISGHQRLTVLEDMGETEADVSVVDLSEIQEKQLNIAMNKVSGEWDDQKLTAILSELGDEAVDTGFTMPEIEVLQNELQSFFEENAVDPSDIVPSENADSYMLMVPFYKADEKDLKAYIKKYGEENIVDVITGILDDESR